MESTNSTSTTTKTGYYSNIPTFKEASQLGKDDFMKILITQLQSQDPLEPLKDREFIAQMTQFSSLEQMTNLNKGMNRFLDYQLNGALAQHSELLNQNVHWKVEENGFTTSGEGIVQAISTKNGDVLVELDTGQKIPLQTIYRVEKVVEQNL